MLEKLETSAMRYHATQVDWMCMEEKFYDNHRVLGFYTRDIVKAGKYNEALSIIKRHKLYQDDKYLDRETLRTIKPYFTAPLEKSFTYLENELFTKDDYAPTEECLGRAKPGTYVHFNDFGLNPEKDLVWIDNCETELFDQAAKEILASKYVGLDSEFKFCITKFDQSGTDTLQLSTGRKVYVLDSLNLSNSPKYDALVRDLLSTQSILKVKTFASLKPITCRSGTLFQQIFINSEWLRMMKKILYTKILSLMLNSS